MNKTINDGLKPYALGEKLRGLRLKKSMGLVQLGKHTGLSPAMLSKLENGRLVPTVPTLLRIAMVFSVGLEYFFRDERKRHVIAIVRKDERIRFPERRIAYRDVGRVSKIGSDNTVSDRMKRWRIGPSLWPEIRFCVLGGIGWTFRCRTLWGWFHHWPVNFPRIRRCHVQLSDTNRHRCQRSAA